MVCWEGISFRRAGSCIVLISEFLGKCLDNIGQIIIIFNLFTIYTMIKKNKRAF